MAKGKITYQEVADEDVYKYVRKSAEDTLATVNVLNAAIKSNAETIKQAAASNPIIDKETINLLNEALAAIKKLTAENVALKAKEKEANEAAKKSWEELTKAEKEHWVEKAKEKLIRSENIKLSTQEAIETQKLGDAYKQLQNQYDVAQRAAKNLAVTTGMNSAETRKATEEANKYGNKLREIDASMHQHFRNVGNYGSAFNGLGNSLNQVTREFPAFINSAQTGFMAISNNLPILMDSIKAVRIEQAALAAEGKASVSTMQALGKAFFSWGTALSLGITALTLGAPMLWKWITGTKEATTETDKFAEAMKGLADRVNKANEELRKSNNIASGESGSYLNRYEELLKKKNAINDYYDKQERANREKLDKESGYKRTDEGIADDMLFTPDKDLQAYIDRKKRLDDAKAIELKSASVVFAQKELEISDKKIEAKSKEEKKIKDVKDTSFEDDQKRIIADAEWNERIEERRIKDRENWLKEQQELVKAYDKWEADQVKEKQAIEDKRIKDKEALAKKEADQRKKNEKEVIDYANKLNDSYFSRRETAEDMKIQNAKDRQQTLALLAQKGVENAAENYAFEQKAQADAEAKKLQLERNKMRAEFGIALLKAYSSNGGDIQKTLKDSAALVAAAQSLPSFYEGTEDTGTVAKPLDNKGGRIAVIHDNERILTKQQNMLLPKGLTNDDLVRQAVMMSPSYHSTITASKGFEGVEKKLDALIDATKSIDIPKHELYYNAYEKSLVHTITSKSRIERNHDRKTGLFS